MFQKSELEGQSYWVIGNQTWRWGNQYWESVHAGGHRGQYWVKEASVTQAEGLIAQTDWKAYLEFKGLICMLSYYLLLFNLTKESGIRNHIPPSHWRENFNPFFFKITSGWWVGFVCWFGRRVALILRGIYMLRQLILEGSSCWKNWEVCVKMFLFFFFF